MSMQEIYGIHLEVQEIKKILEDITGLKFDGSKLKNQLELDLNNVKSILMDVVQQCIIYKERIYEMSFNLENLEREVARAQTVQTSAVTLLKSLTHELDRISAELSAKAAQSPPEIDTAPLNDLIDKLKNSTDVLASAVSDSTNVVPVKEVILNADDPTKPTISVVMPEVLPENIVVTAETIVDSVDPASSEPQVIVTVEEAPAEPAPDQTVVSDVIETPTDQVNVNIEVAAEVVEEIKAEADVDVIEVVKEAVAEAEVPAEPAPVTEETQPQP